MDVKNFLNFFKKPQLAVVFFSVVLSLLICEISLRMITVRRDPLLKCRVADDQLHHLLRAGTVCQSKTSEWDVEYRINSLGIRGPEIQAKAGNELRILILGDSFVEGYGVSEKDRFTGLMRDELKRNSKENISIINAGVAGYSPVLELQLLKKIYDMIRPDVVVVALDMTDFKDSIGYYNFLAERDKQAFSETGSRLDEEEKKEYFAALTRINFEQSQIQKYKQSSGWEQNKNLPFATKVKMYLRKSELYVFLTNFIKDKLNKPYLVTGSPPFIEGDAETDTFAVTRPNLDEKVYQSLWLLPKRSFSGFVKFAQEKNFKLMFFTYPHGMQVDGKQWGKGRLTRGFVRGKAYSVRPLYDFVALGNELGVPTLNLLDAFRNNSNERLFFDYDGHFTTDGHKVVAAEMAKFISENIEELK